MIALLREVFKIHPLAVEDAQEFNQRPKVEDYDDFVYLVAYGARRPRRADGRGALLLPENFLVSVHRDTIPAIADACRTLTRLHTDRRLVALYRLLDALVDSMFPYLAAFDDRIDELQDQIFGSPTRSSWPSCSRSSASSWTCARWSPRSGTGRRPCWRR